MLGVNVLILLREVPLTWNNWIRQIHRWLVIVITVTAIAPSTLTRRNRLMNAQKSATRTTAKNKTAVGFTNEERAAMKEHAQELKTAARRGSRTAKADGEKDVLAKIAEMAESDRVMAERLHAVVRASAPDLSPKLWYGMPAYAKGGKVVRFFQSAEKFKSRYATFGFSDMANLDDGAMWPTAFALTKLTAADETRIGELVKKAVG
ncbi:iron chaperone [Nocardia sp. 2YAB30]|uniref:iron chaperone n=1 Tax=unclassified Nocardia TaxID=2637762 RepID=UPI003F95C679